MNLDKRVRHLIFDLLYYTGTLNLLQPRRSGLGIIFLLHRVVPAGTPILASDLVIQSDYLDEILSLVRRLGWDIVSITEVRRRLVEGDKKNNFACFTFDDGYLDNLHVALPIFRKHRAPMCVYITTGLVDRTHYLWWPVVEQMLLTRDKIETFACDRRETWSTRTVEQKRTAYWKLLPLLDSLGRFDSELMELFHSNGVDPKSTLDPMILNWQEARELAADPLVEIGCHTVSHRPLASIELKEVTRELTQARETIEKQVNVKVHHMSYPFGRKPECSDREFQAVRDAGFQTGTTTRPGNIFPTHKDHMGALPRLNLCGGISASLRQIREGLFGASVRLNYVQAPVTD